MKAIFDQLKREASALISTIGLKTGSKKVIGLDIGHKTFRAIRSDEGARQSDIKNILVKDIPCLKDLNRDFQVQPDEKIVINFHGDNVAIRRASVPLMPYNEIATALKWQLKDNVQFDINKAMIKFDILGEKEAQAGIKKLDVIAIIYKEEDIEKKVDELKKLGLNIQAVFLSEFALNEYVRHLNMVSSHDKVAIVDIGNARTNIAIIENKKLCFSRDIAMGGDDITEAMTGVVVSDKGKMELSREDAEKIKCEQGIPEDMKILSLMRPVLERLTSQILSSLEYCESQFSCTILRKIILAGSGSKLKGFKEYVLKETGIETLSILPEAACATGLSLISDSSLNIIPERFATEKKAAFKKISARMIFILAVSLYLISYGLLSAKAVSLKNNIEVVKSQWNNIKDMKPVKKRVVEITNAVSKISQHGLCCGSIMKELSSITPAYVILNTLAIGKDAPNIRISGIISKGDKLTEFMKEIEGSPLFENVKLKFSNQRASEVSSKDILNFEIVFDVTK
nr:pilus assembly protein PilM [Candidatus Omnitrophota bacterium]